MGTLSVASLALVSCILGGAPAAPSPVVEDAAPSGPRIAGARVETIPGDQQLLEPKRRVVRVYAHLDKPGPERAYFRCDVGPSFGSTSATISHLLRDSYAEIMVPMTEPAARKTSGW